MIWFIVGAIFGGTFGVMIASVLAAAKHEDVTLQEQARDIMYRYHDRMKHE